MRVTRLRLHQVRGSHNPGGFDFERFMRWQGIYVVGGVSNPERLSLQHRPEGFRLDRTLEQWRQRLRAGVRTLLSAPYDAVFLAMVIGQRGDLTPDGAAELPGLWHDASARRVWPECELYCHWRVLGLAHAPPPGA